jgi:hypothetical protein
MVPEIQSAATWVSLLVGLLVTSLFVHLSARIVLDRAHFGQAFLTALVGTLIAGLVLLGTGRSWAGFLLAAAAWALVAASFYRTRWSRGAVIGLVAWVLAIVVDVAVHALIK